MLTAEFESQNTESKKKNARPDVTQFIIEQKVDPIHCILILFSALYKINRLYNSS